MSNAIHFNGISIEEISDFLLKKGFTVGSNKPSEYISRGLVLSGMRNINNGGSKAYKSYYSPIVLIEFMSASLLKKGNWLKLDSRLTHTKLTDRDVFYGRLAFYDYLYSSNNFYDFFFKKLDVVTQLPLRHFYTEITYWFPTQPNSPKTVSGEPLYMENSSINTFLNISKKQLLPLFQFGEAVDSYIEWAKWQYGLTFTSVFKEYVSELFSLQLTRVVAKANEGKIEGDEKKENKSLLPKILKK